jgi:hypothetical protein
VYIHKSKQVFLLVSVDDLLVAEDKGTVLSVKAALKDVFKITDLGHAKFFLGMEITLDRTKKQLILSQVQYSMGVLDRFDMGDTDVLGLLYKNVPTASE